MGETAFVILSMSQTVQHGCTRRLRQHNQGYEWHGAGGRDGLRNLISVTIGAAWMYEMAFVNIINVRMARHR